MVKYHHNQPAFFSFSSMDLERKGIKKFKDYKIKP